MSASGLAGEKVLANSEARLGLVDVQDTFGTNPLCPAWEGERLASGIDARNLDLEVARLLNLDGTGDRQARQRVDRLVASYRDWRECLLDRVTSFYDGSDCDLSAAFAEVKDEALAVVEYLGDTQIDIFGNLVSPPGTSDDTREAAYDRSRNLFHPTASGHAVQACAVAYVFRDAPVRYCGRGGDSTPTLAMAARTTQSGGEPIEVDADRQVQVHISGFLPDSQVRAAIPFNTDDLGSTEVDGSGGANATVTLPELTPGVYELEFQGSGVGGVQKTETTLVRIPGSPTGSYTTYLTGFTKRPYGLVAGTQIETVNVTYHGQPIGEFQVDAHGGVLVPIPAIIEKEATIAATSTLDGTVVEEVVHPESKQHSIWALDPSGPGISITGSRFSATGLVHSESAIRVTGAGGTFTGGVEYVTSWTQTGVSLTTDPEPVQVEPGTGQPVISDIANHRPDGVLARASSSYTAIPASECKAGTWKPKPGLDGLDRCDLL